MRLADAIEDTTPVVRPSKVDRLLEQLEPDDRTQFEAMMMAPLAEWSHVRLATVLSKVSGEYISANSIGEWRRARGVS